MEKQLNFGLKMTLEQLALRRVVVNAWSENDVLISIQKYLFLKLSKQDRIKVWRETIESDVKEKISDIVIIESLKKEMIVLVRPMGLDLLKWIWFHKKQLNSQHEIFDLRILEQLCRNDKVAIDYKETAAKLVHLQMLNVINRYKLACRYCLVNCIPGLFEDLPDDFKITLYDEQNILAITNVKMHFYWAYIIKGKESKLNDIARSYFKLNFNDFAFECLAIRGNKVATEYFFQKLTTEERDFSLFRTLNSVQNAFLRARFCDNFPVEKSPEVFCYLLTLLIPEHQLQVLQEYPCSVLQYFLDWPWQDVFLELADILWGFIPEIIYGHLLCLMNEKVKYLGYYFPNFFQNFFLHSPKNFRKHYASNSKLYFFSQFFDAEDTETIRIIFRSMDAEDRMLIISSFTFFELFNELMMKNKEHLIKLCLREATLSEEDKETWKHSFSNFLIDINILDVRSNSQKQLQLQQLLHFLDEIYSHSKKQENF